MKRQGQTLRGWTPQASTLHVAYSQIQDCTPERRVHAFCGTSSTVGASTSGRQKWSLQQSKTEKNIVLHVRMPFVKKLARTSMDKTSRSDSTLPAPTDKLHSSSCAQPPRERSERKDKTTKWIREDGCGPSQHTNPYFSNGGPPTPAIPHCMEIARVCQHKSSDSGHGK